MKVFQLYIVVGLISLLIQTPAYSRELPVFPYPQYVEQGNDQVLFSTSINLRFVALDKDASGRLLGHWKAFTKEQKTIAKQQAIVTVGLIGKDKNFDLLVKSRTAASIDKIGKEGYILIFNAKQKIIAANTETGLFYGLQSLKQLGRAKWNKEIFIADWPSLPMRIICDDISRGPISTVNYIKQQIERMAEIKINALTFYIEHVVQPFSHPDFAPDSGKLTIPQIKELSAYASKFHMQLIGNFQSFGHLEKILSLPQYKSMGETSTLISPLDPKAKRFLEDVIGELCDAFSSPYFNVNCDETFDLTKGRSKKYIDSIGAGRFYADHLQFLYDVLKRHNKKMMMWGDVALEHEEVLDMLPKDVIYLTWEYSIYKNYDKWILPFVKRGLEFMVCPGILNSYRMFPDMLMAKANIRGFIDDAVKYNATGAITAVFDDGGTYLFSEDWYGVYVAADKSWNAGTKPEASFDERYELSAYGTVNGSYVKALNKLMELRALPITYSLNDQVWRQKILPDSGQQLIVNNSSAKAALDIINDAAKFIATANPKWHTSDKEALQFVIDQYKLTIDTRVKLAGVAYSYNDALTIKNEPFKVRAALLKAETVVNDLKVQYQHLRQRFKTAWLKDNQPYSLNVVLQAYDKKIDDLKELSVNLIYANSLLTTKVALPAIAQIRLNITESADYYFQNWLLGGPFPFTTHDKLPGFLYSENSEYNKPPKPGDYTHYKGKTYKWQKFASQNGGIVDLDEQYTLPQNVLAYAYCSITSEQFVTTNAFLTSNNGSEVFCNGEKVYSDTPDGANALGEKKMTISLKAGVNHLLIKLPKTTGKPWSFTFHLDKDLSVTTHKHKYQLNPNKTTYEAD